MAASEVDLPEPVPPTRITKPRFESTTSLSTGGNSSSSSVGIFALIVRRTAAVQPCWMKALTRNRPMPGGAIAKLHSLVESNSLVCRSFMIARTKPALCSAVRLRSDCGRSSPSTLIAGGKPAVMNRSEPFFSTMRRSRSCMSRMACSRSISDAVLVLRLVARLFAADNSLGHQVLQALIESLHALALAGLDGRVHLGDFTVADQVADRRRADHDFVRRNASAANLLHERLRYDGSQTLGEHGAHHLLFGRGKHIDDAVDRLGRGTRMQRAEHQVAGLRGGEREADRFQVAHFTDEYDVGVFAQRRAQRLAEPERVAMDLALIDETAFALVHELDRILDGYNMIGTVVVAVVDHARERRRLAGSGRSGHEHEASGKHA